MRSLRSLDFLFGSLLNVTELSLEFDVALFISLCSFYVSVFTLETDCRELLTWGADQTVELRGCMGVPCTSSPTDTSNSYVAKLLSIDLFLLFFGIYYYIVGNSYQDRRSQSRNKKKIDDLIILILKRPKKCRIF